MKKLFIVLGILLLGIPLLLYAVRNPLSSFILKKIFEKRTGQRMEIKNLNIGLFDQSLKMEGLRIEEPPDYPQGIMILIENLETSYQLKSFFSNQIKIGKTFLNLDQFNLIRKGNQEYNFMNFKKAIPPSKKPPKNYHIDELTLRVSTISYTDLVEKEAQPLSVAVNLERNFKNITDINQLQDELAKSTIHESLKSIIDKLTLDFPENKFLIGEKKPPNQSLVTKIENKVKELGNKVKEAVKKQ